MDSIKLHNSSSERLVDCESAANGRQLSYACLEPQLSDARTKGDDRRNIRSVVRSVCVKSSGLDHAAVDDDGIFSVHVYVAPSHDSARVASHVVARGFFYVVEVVVLYEHAGVHLRGYSVPRDVHVVVVEDVHRLAKSN